MLTSKAKHLRAVGNATQGAQTVEGVQKPELKDLIRLAVRSYSPPPWKAIETQHFFEMTSIQKDKPKWQPTFAGQAVIRNAFINQLSSELAFLSANDYEKLTHFLDDIFVYEAGLYGLINGQLQERNITAPNGYMDANISFYPYDTEKGLKSLFEPQKLAEIEKELSPFAKDLIQEITQASARKNQFIPEVQLRHYLSLLHHFMTEMKVAMANQK